MSRGRVIGPLARTAISLAVCCRMASTDCSFSPAAIANVAPSSVLIPQSAWPAPTSVSGLALAYGMNCRSIAAAAYQPLCWAT